MVFGRTKLKGENANEIGTLVIADKETGPLEIQNITLAVHLGTFNTQFNTSTTRPV